MKTYLLVRSKHTKQYWYGYYENTSCYWSNWDNLENIFNRKLISEARDKKSSYDDFLKHTQTPEAKVQIIETSDKPITYKQIQDKYPELLI
ncbi:MAG: hypothetical protein PVF17_05885 [Ignavibacteria bacterium]|jgi:hypothetical protein